MVSRSQKRDTECFNEEFNYPMLEEARGEREAPPGPGGGGGLGGDDPPPLRQQTDRHPGPGHALKHETRRVK